MVFYCPPGTVVAMTQLQPTSTLRQPGATPSRAALWLYAAYAVLLAVACLGPMVPQAASYHAFADQRSWGALPFAMDVLTNLPFLLLGLAGLWAAVLHAPQRVVDAGARGWLAWVFGGLVATAVGSGYYHMAPDDWRVFWDRMGMVPVFAGVLALAVQSQLGSRPAQITAGLVALCGPLSLVVWLRTGQLLPWAVLQGAGMVLIVVLAVAQWRKPGALAGAVRWPLLAIVLWYAAAKVFELGDGAVWQMTGGWVSGHSLKHVAAALATLPLLWCVQRWRNAERIQPTSPAVAAGTMGASRHVVTGAHAPQAKR